MAALTVALASTAAAGFVSFRKPDGLVLSEGNLYFTSHAASTASVWRAAQDSIPGQEILLYSEADARFGDIVFAQVGSNFFGYFFAKKAGVITIRRVPLAGGAAIVLKTVTGVDVEADRRNLITDGVNLYWQDDTSVRKMPIGGGAVAVLDQTGPNERAAGLALRNGNVIYAAGPNIRFVPLNFNTISPLARTIATATTRITALYAEDTRLYWGEQSGAVRMRFGSTTVTLQPAIDRVPTSIASQAWTECGSQSCLLRTTFAASSLTKTIGADALGIAVTSSSNVFWGDAAGVHRLVDR